MFLTPESTGMFPTTCFAASVQDCVTIKYLVYDMQDTTAQLPQHKDANLNLVYCHQTIILQLSHVVTVIHFTTQDGNTALIQASFKGHHRVVELILRAGANPDMQNKVSTECMGQQCTFKPE